MFMYFRACISVGKYTKGWNPVLCVPLTLLDKGKVFDKVYEKCMGVSDYTSWSETHGIVRLSIFSPIYGESIMGSFYFPDY